MRSVAKQLPAKHLTKRDCNSKLLTEVAKKLGSLHPEVVQVNMTKLQEDHAALFVLLDAIVEKAEGWTSDTYKSHYEEASKIQTQIIESDTNLGSVLLQLKDCRLKECKTTTDGRRKLAVKIRNHMRPRPLQKQGCPGPIIT